MMNTMIDEFENVVDQYLSIYLSLSLSIYIFIYL